jgi:alkanesulfonate monooxygenase SsuD/methylene tetrahydromethanopterin reductase-like flavin-dependent oxidoreductase (luciferase family)
VSFAGEHYRCEGITIEPKPAAKPRPPIWIANNAGRGGFGPADNRALVERTLRRVVNHADGWQTSLYGPADLRWRIGYLREQAAAKGRDPHSIETHLYHNINVNEDRQAALEEAKKFLDIYYTDNYSMAMIDGWVATGTPEQCAARLRQMRDVGFDEVTVRIAGWDQFGQLKRVLEEVLPRVAA